MKKNDNQTLTDKDIILSEKSNRRSFLAKTGCVLSVLSILSIATAIPKKAIASADLKDSDGNSWDGENNDSDGSDHGSDTDSSSMDTADTDEN